MKPKILLTSIPKLEELKYYQGVIDFSLKEYENNLSNYNWRKIKTRFLIKNHPDILAAPSEKWPFHVHLIIPEKRYKDSDLKVIREENKIALIGPKHLFDELYLKCVVYTLSVKLSPEWNWIDKFFVKSHFLNSNAAVESVKVQLSKTDGCLVLCISALRLKIPMLSLIDMGVDIQALHNEGSALIRQRVFILPYLKPATAVAVHLNLPLSCPFKNYDDLKNHWKILYDYNLPEKKEEMMYVEVLFDRNDMTYLYPIICVCPYEPLQFKCKNEIKIINEFRQALEQKCPKICGYPIQSNINQDIFRPVCQLYLASEVIDKPNLEPLSSFSPDVKAIQSHRNENNTEVKCASTVAKQDPENRGSSSLMLFPFNTVIPPRDKMKLSEETFKCFPIFRPKIKTNFSSCNPHPAKRIKLSPQQNGSQSKHKNPTNSLESSTARGIDPSKEVEVLARAKNLKKLTLSVLVQFCRENNISVKVKDRKDVVMEKIYNFISKI